jgi:hypothetical protein
MPLPRNRIYDYMFHCPLTAGEVRRFERRPGVYVVTCACGKGSYPLEIGETADVQSFLLTHAAVRGWRKRGCPCPKRSRGPVYFAAFYCPEGGRHDRKALVARIRQRAEAESRS